MVLMISGRQIQILPIPTESHFTKFYRSPKLHICVYIICLWLHTCAIVWPLLHWQICCIVGKLQGRKCSRISQFKSHLRKFSPWIWACPTQDWVSIQRNVFSVKSSLSTDSWKFSPSDVACYGICDGLTILFSAVQYIILWIKSLELL